MDASTNALLIDGDAPLTLPDFARIRTDDFRPAIERGMQVHRDELAALVAQTAEPDFANTMAAFDRCGHLLGRGRRGRGLGRRRLHGLGLVVMRARGDRPGGDEGDREGAVVRGEARASRAT